MEREQRRVEDEEGTCGEKTVIDRLVSLPTPVTELIGVAKTKRREVSVTCRAPLRPAFLLLLLLLLLRHVCNSAVAHTQNPELLPQDIHTPLWGPAHTAIDHCEIVGR
ncbi:unnamed protein product [Pleuronectes platessa]|uniref:Uncharacterized protein n=1 Tax=Pleuronectes platessa TaxID=8262 RepID=A0A9N7YYZ1_PLEPL|nr:unnamed protein product [Pleuronectes platessa]